MTFYSITTCDFCDTQTDGVFVGAVAIFFGPVDIELCLTSVMY